MTMQDKLIGLMDAFFMTLVSFYMALSGLPFVTILGVVSSILSVLFWLSKIKREIENNHGGSIGKWLKYFIKKTRK